jgi:Tol biopolymer transport system component
MAEIGIALQELKEESESGTLRPPAAVPPRKRARWPYYATGGLLVAALIAAIFYFQSQRAASPLRARVLTSFVGLHGDPSLSPDGNQFAFAWDGDVPHGKNHVYISLVGKGTPLRLSPEDDSADGPSWSPDGQSIAFQHRPGKSETSDIAVMPALGGPAHRVAHGIFPSDPRWSPDGKFLVFAQRDGSGFSSIYVAAAAGGDPRRLIDPPASGKADAEPSISPDGRQLVFSRINGDFDTDLYLADFHEGQSTGPPRRLTNDHRPKFSPIWANDGQ